MKNNLGRCIKVYAALGLSLLIGFVWSAANAESVDLDSLLSELKGEGFHLFPGPAGRKRVVAAKKLGELKDPRAVIPIGEALIVEESEVVAIEMINALATIGDERAVKYLIQVATNGGQLEKGNKFWTGDQTAVSEWYKVRGKAVYALGVFRNSSSIAPLISILLKASNVPPHRLHSQQINHFQCALLTTLGQISDSRVLPIILSHLTKDETLVRTHDANPYHVNADAITESVRIEVVKCAVYASIELIQGESQEVVEKVLTVLARRIGSPGFGDIDMFGGGWPLDTDEWVQIIGNQGEAGLSALLSVLGPEGGGANARSAIARYIVSTSLDNSQPAFLFTALKEKNLKILSDYYHFYIGLSKAGSEPILIESLHRYGDRDMAESFLHSGNRKLEAASRQWAKKNGYQIVEVPPKGTNNIGWK